MAAKKDGKQVKVTLVRSTIGADQRQRGTVRALGLRKIRQTVTHTDSPVLRGMINHVSHLVEVEEAK
jgi:large subunit ribosomal protein L30